MKITGKKDNCGTGGKKPDEQKLTLIGLILYGLIMLSLIIIYKDFLISVTAVVIMLVMLVQYIVPILRERRLNKGN